MNVLFGHRYDNVMFRSITGICLLLFVGLASCSNVTLAEQEKTTLAQQDEQLYNEITKEINRGDTESGISKLNALMEKYPDNPRYRNMLKFKQNTHIANLLKSADQYRHDNQFIEAEKLYLKVLTIEPQQQRAKEALVQLKQINHHAEIIKEAKGAIERQDEDTAKNRLRQVLAEDANQPEARALLEQIDMQQYQKITANPQIKSAFKKAITLELKNVPIKTVFELIGKTGNINFTFDQELRTDLNTSLFVRNTTIEDAIQIILTTNQLGKKILNSNTVLIFGLNRSQEYQEQFVRSFYLNSMDAKRAMNMIKTVLKSKDIYIDEKLNTLIMRDTAENIQIAEKLIASQDMIEPEVILEVEVMEINRKNLEAIGVQYPTRASVGVQGNSSNNSSATASPGRLSLAELKQFNSNLGVFTISDPVLALNLLQQSTDSNLLANPQIRVKNREKAKIHVGDKIPVLTSVANATGFVSQTVSYIDVGIKLDVEPTILLQNQVSIKVGLEVSNVTDQVKTDNGVLAYTIGSRNANTILQLKDGETQMLAGLFRDDSQRISNKVPGLSGLPFIGRLFTDNNDDKRKNEIVLLITPRILHNIAPANAVYSLFPTGPAHDMRGANNVSRANELSNQVTTEVTQSPKSIQADRAKLDQGFSSQLAQPSEPANNETSNNSTLNR